MTRLPACLMLAAASVAPLLHAEPALQVFGVVDQFLTHIEADGVPGVTRIDASGFLASRIGVRGGEAFGGGLHASYLLEAGINPDDGSGADANRLFNRQAWVGIDGRFGELRLGRQNTPQFVMNGRFDAFASGTQASGWNNLFGAAPRVDRAIAYVSPAWHGIKAQVLAGRGATGGAAPIAALPANANWHSAIEYTGQAWYVGANHELIRNAAVSDVLRRSALAASYRLTPGWTVYGALGREVRGDGGMATRILSLSALRQLTPALLLAFGGAGLRDGVQGAGHGNARQVSAQLRYKMSQRTMLYGACSRLNQDGSRNNLVLGGAAVVQAAARIASAPGGAIKGLQAGLVHSF
jgi:predicted porin